MLYHCKCYFVTYIKNMRFSHEYFIIDDTLQRIDADMDAAECHGQLVGMLAATMTADKADWIKNTLCNTESGDSFAKECDQILTDLYSDTQAMLQSEELGFELLLPDDDGDMALRLVALGHWSQGFLFGIATAGIKNTESLPGEIPEFIRDLTEISRADSFELEQAEEDENAYTEIVEYIRVGVMLMRTEMQHLYEQADSTPTQ